uniref:Type I cytokine receptor cytokine-binding domain-containing protein n=1 Tax=Latimeria chalumnae TaxID=7897 RepID=H2ZS78_LATCH
VWITQFMAIFWFWVIIIIQASSTCWTQNSKLIEILAPVSFSITIVSFGEVHFSWKQNPAQRILNYSVKHSLGIKNPITERWQLFKVSKLSSRKLMVLHKGVFARVRTIFEQNNILIAQSNWTESQVLAQPGDNGTSVNNLSCVIYNNSYLNCTWDVGKEASKDTQYSLYYRQENTTEECQQYQKDTWDRNIGCQFSNTTIMSLNPQMLVIYVNGSSKQAAIQPFDQIFDPFEIEKSNPPVKVTILVNEGLLRVSWKQPHTSYLIESHCFKYQINIRDLK